MISPAANGGMYGADVFVLTNTGGQWSLQDRFASGFFMPELDGAYLPRQILLSFTSKTYHTHRSQDLSAT